MRVRPGIATLAMLLALLCGCASIPLSTALRFSSWSVERFAQVDPAQVRVRLSVDRGYRFDIPQSRLQVSMTDSRGAPHVALLPLSQLRTFQEQRSRGWLSRDVDVETSLLSLSPEGAARLRELQRRLLEGKPQSFEITVTGKLAELPSAPRKITFWADLRLADGEPFVPLIDGADIEFRQE